MTTEIVRQNVFDALSKNLRNQYLYKKTTHSLVCDEKDRVLILFLPFTYWRASCISLEISAYIKFKSIEKEYKKYTKVYNDYTIRIDFKKDEIANNSFYFYEETLTIETKKIVEVLKHVESYFFDAYKEPKDVKDLFLVPYKDASPITMKPDNFLYKRLVFCKMFGEPIEEEYIDEGREFFIKNRPHRPDDLKNFEEFCSKIKTSMSSK